MFYKTFLSASAVLALTALPGFAASHAEMDASAMTCGDFMAMDANGMMAAAAAVDVAMQEMAAGDAAAAEGTDATAGASTDDAAAMAGSDEESAEGMMEADDAMAADTSKKLMEACVGHEDMLALDALHAE